RAGANISRQFCQTDINFVPNCHQSRYATASYSAGHHFTAKSLQVVAAAAATSYYQNINRRSMAVEIINRMGNLCRRCLALNLHIVMLDSYTAPTTFDNLHKI